MSADVHHDQAQCRGIDRPGEAHTHATAFDLDGSRAGRSSSLHRDASRRVGPVLIIVSRRDQALDAERNEYGYGSESPDDRKSGY